MRKATSLKVEGDWTFGPGVQVVGAVTLEAHSAQRIEAGAVLSEASADESSPAAHATSAAKSAKPGGRRNG